MIDSSNLLLVVDGSGLGFSLTHPYRGVLTCNPQAPSPRGLQNLSGKYAQVSDKITMPGWSVDKFADVCAIITPMKQIDERVPQNRF